MSRDEEREEDEVVDDEQRREPWGPFELAIAGMTHVGRTRRINQDAFDRFDDRDRGEILLVVADGLGGHRGGEVASKMAVGTLGKLVREAEGEAEVRLLEAIRHANEFIFRAATKDRTLKGMGTTVVALLLRADGSAFVAHAGDSRLYRIREGRIEPLTEDHSVVALMVREGLIQPEEARDHPKKNQIMRALGVSDEIETDVAPVEVRPGDSYLLCSDGLYGMLPDEDLRRISGSAPDPETAVAWLIDAANQAGGADNITALLVRVFAPAGPAAPRPEASALPDATLPEATLPDSARDPLKNLRS
ncbi:MAG TPA: Stp1/IreP family PP2C-type Ser/Thr phosphatase [Myxococcota bacterium]|nr:Stp1/IreP family PP2C-type Ser/Thr phosphatase [Myxococcota bacterium]